MRALRIIGVFLVVVICFSACERAQTPERVAESFLNYLEKGEFDKAADYGTKNTHSLLETLKAFEELGNQFGETEKVDPREIRDIECVVEGESAVCIYFADDEQGEIDLVKEDGKWLVDMKKESPFDDESFDDDMEEFDL